VHVLVERREAAISLRQVAAVYDLNDEELLAGGRIAKSA
jgi:hypothetical protein